MLAHSVGVQADGCSAVETASGMSPVLLAGSCDCVLSHAVGWRVFASTSWPSGPLTLFLTPTLPQPPTLTLFPARRSKDDEHGSGGKIVAGMPNGNSGGPGGGSLGGPDGAGSNGTYGSSRTDGSHGAGETTGLISGRKTSRCACSGTVPPFSQECLLQVSSALSRRVIWG